MKIDLSRTKDVIGEQFAFEISEKLPGFDYNGTEYRFDGAVSVKGIYQPTEGEITVTAEAAAILTAPCDRCLASTKIPVKIGLAETFSLEASEDTYVFSGNEFVLDKAVTDNIVLNIPMHVLCSKDCKGLCPHCGKDRNKETCDCEEEMKKANSPFAALDGMFSDER